MTATVRLVEKLSAATWYACNAGDRITVPLSALSLGCLCVDLPDPGGVLGLLAERRDVAFYGALLLGSGINSRHHEALTSWVDRADEQTIEAYRDCLQVVAEVDLVKLSEQEDVLGVVYGELQGRYDRSAQGAFYTPLDVARLVAAMTLSPDVKQGQTFYDPTCGSGTMFIGTADALRDRGFDPLDFSWHGQDLDGIACCLAAVNLTYRRIARVPRARDLRWLALDGLNFEAPTEGAPPLPDGS